MEAFIYCADIYCGDCGRAIRQRIRKEYKEREESIPFDTKDETTFDSDEYPKGPYLIPRRRHYSPQHCGSGAECINAYRLQDETKVGCFLENPLTTDGYKYVEEAIKESKKGFGNSEVVELWADYYSIPFEEEEND